MYYHLRDFVGSTAFSEIMMDKETRDLFLSGIKRWFVFLFAMYSFLLPTSYWQTFRSYQAGELEGPVLLQGLWLISYPYFLVVGFACQIPLSMGCALSTARKSGNIIRTTLAKMKVVLLRVSLNVHLTEDEEQLALAELSEINRAATALLHPYRRISPLLKVFTLAGLATIIVMALALLLPEQTETTKVLGLCNGVFIGLMTFVGCLYCASQQSVIFQEEMQKFHDCRLMKAYIRLFGNRKEFVTWLEETDMSATKIMGTKVTTALFAKLASITVSLSGTIIYITGRRSLER